MAPNQPNARDLILDLRSQGYSLAEIGRQIGRSPRALRFVVAGERDGEALRDSLDELSREGKVTHQAPRPVTKSGQLAKVRAPGGRTTTPPKPAGAGVRRARTRSLSNAPSNVQGLISAALADGHSYAEIGRQVGRSADTIRKAHRGETGQVSQELLRRPLQELYTDGVVTHQALRVRKTTGRGEPVKIKGKGGTYITPPRPKGVRDREFAEQRDADTKIDNRPGHVGSTTRDQPEFREVPSKPVKRVDSSKDLLRRTDLGGGRAFFEAYVTKAGRKGRGQLNSELSDMITGAANARRRFHLQVFVEGMDTPIPIGGKGGYDPAQVAQLIEHNNGNVLDWVSDQVGDRYETMRGGGHAVVTGVQFDVW